MSLVQFAQMFLGAGAFAAFLMGVADARSGLRAAREDRWAKAAALMAGGTWMLALAIIFLLALLGLGFVGR